MLNGLQDHELFPDNELNDNGDLVHFMLLAESEPVKMEEALSDPKWMCAINEKVESIEKNKTWELVDLLEGNKPISVRWVYKVKENSKGEIIKHKARLIAKGFLQRQGIDFEEVFAPVAKIETIGLVVGIANNNNWSIYQMISVFEWPFGRRGVFGTTFWFYYKKIKNLSSID